MRLLNVFCSLLGDGETRNHPTTRPVLGFEVCCRKGAVRKFKMCSLASPGFYKLFEVEIMGQAFGACETALGRFASYCSSENLMDEMRIMDDLPYNRVSKRPETWKYTAVHRLRYGMKDQR